MKPVEALTLLAGQVSDETGTLQAALPSERAHHATLRLGRPRAPQSSTKRATCGTGPAERAQAPKRHAELGRPSAPQT